MLFYLTHPIGAVSLENPNTTTMALLVLNLKSRRKVYVLSLYICSLHEDLSGATLSAELEQADVASQW